MPPPGGKDKAAEERFANFMTSTAGGTQGSSSYGVNPPSSGGSGNQNNQSQEEIIQQAQQNFQNQKKIQEEFEKERLSKLAQEQGIAAAQEKQDSLLGRIKTNLMGGGEDGNLSLTKEEAYANLPAGMHPLRKQYEYLKEKYGPNWANTTQAKVLESYLSGVPVERGGGLGARSDETDAELIGPTNVDDIPMYDPVTGKYRSLEERQALAEAAQARLDALNQFAGMGSGGIGSLSAAEAGASGFDLSKLDPKQLRLGLSPDQYFRFRQQLMAADPTAENQLYKDTFPYSSGAGLSTLFEKFAPMPLKALAGMLPERDLSGYQQNIDPISVGFEPLPVPDQSNSNEPVRRPGFMPIIPLPDPSQPERPRYPLPGDPKRPPFMPPFMPDGGNFPLPVGINAFNPMFLGPSFRGSPYTNQGVSPAFYENLRRYNV